MLFNSLTKNDLSLRSSLVPFGLLLTLMLLILAGVSCDNNPASSDPDPNPTGLSCQITQATPSSGPAPLNVSFLATASGGLEPYAYQWSFGDGTVASLPNPQHVFNSPGTYQARVIVTDARQKADTAITTIVVNSATGLSCTAAADKTNGPAPLTVNFSGSALGGRGPHSYSWTFGDGGVSSQSSPSHTFQTAGSYTTRLTVRDADGATCSKNISITATTVGSPLTCTASSDKASGRIPLVVAFSGVASGGRAPYSYRWNFGDGTSSNSSSPSHNYTNGGSYTAKLTVTDANSATCTKTISISAYVAPAGPALSGPSTSTGTILLSWTYSWPSLMATGERVSVERSLTSSSSGFSEIASVSRSSGSQVSINAPTAGTYYFRVRAFVNQGVNPGWTKYSNVVTVVVQSAQASKTRFVNNTSYAIISLIVDGQQYFTASPQGILPGQYYELNLTPGNHSYKMVNGFWDGYSRFEMYVWNGTVNQREGRTETVSFPNPTIAQMLTQFNGSGYWEGDFWENLVPHKAGFRFYSNGTWKLYVDGSQRSTGTYSLVRRQPGTFSVVFSVGGFEGTLYETMGKFMMKNGPADWPWIEYYYQGN